MKNLDLFGWFVESNQKNNSKLNGVRLLNKSNRSVTVFVESFDCIQLTDCAQVELFELRFEADNIRKVEGGYSIQLFAFQDNDLMTLPI